MEMLKRTPIFIFMCFAMAGVARSQEVPAAPDQAETIRSQALSADMQRLAERIERRIEENHPDWRLERIIPIVPSENVIIDQWRFGDKAIRMSVVPHRSAIEAREAIQHFARYMRVLRKFEIWGKADTGSALMELISPLSRGE